MKKILSILLAIMMMASVVSISIPLIVIFLIFKNKIMAGVSRGGVKG